MHGRGTSKDLSGRTFVPAHHAKYASLLSLSCVLLPAGSDLRRLEGPLVCRSRKRKNFIRHWHRHDCARNECRPAGGLYIWLSFTAAFSGWIFVSILQIAGVLPCSRLCYLFHSAAYDLG